MNKKVRLVLIIVFSIIFVFSACSIINYFSESYANQKRFDELAEIVNINTENHVSSNGNANTESSDDKTQVSVNDVASTPNFSKLAAQNSDIVGWISINGTKINYPVMQTKNEPNFYLNHNFDKKSSKYGCIYSQANCDVFEPSDNVIIYGHNMKDGSMFGDLLKFKNKSFWKSHKTISFNTLISSNTYEIIAVFKTTGSGDGSFRYINFVNADDKNEFDAYINKCKELSLYDTGVTAQYGDKLITLSTCEYSQKNGRLVVVAKRK